MQAKWIKGKTLMMSSWHRGVVAITPAQLRNGEDLWQWSRLKIRLGAFRQSTIPQKQFIFNIIISWFKTFTNKQNCKFISFNIKIFYPTSTKELLTKCLSFAETKIQITKVDKKIIYHLRKPLAFDKGNTWMKKKAIFLMKQWRPMMGLKYENFWYLFIRKKLVKKLQILFKGHYSKITSESNQKNRKLSKHNSEIKRCHF